MNSTQAVRNANDCASIHASFSLLSPDSNRRRETLWRWKIFAAREESRSEMNGLNLSKRNSVGQSRTLYVVQQTPTESTFFALLNELAYRAWLVRWRSYKSVRYTVRISA